MLTLNPQPSTTDPTRGKENLRSHWMDDYKKIYDELFEHAMHLLNDHQKPAELVAGTMMAIAQRIYKTQLNEEEYQEPYNIKKERLHWKNINELELKKGTIKEMIRVLLFGTKPGWRENPLRKGKVLYENF